MQIKKDVLFIYYVKNNKNISIYLRNNFSTDEEFIEEFKKQNDLEDIEINYFQC